MNRKRVFVAALSLAALALALLPMLRIARILSAAGVDVPSNDETGLLPRLLAPAFSAHYNWLHFPRDVFVNGHIVALPALIYIVLARFDHLHLYPILFGMLIVTFARVLLFYDATTFRSRSRTPYAATALLLLLSLLSFSVTQMSVFEYPMQTMNTGFSSFGFALGIWALARWPDKTGSVVLAIVAGLISSFSYASGLALWLIFPVCMIAFGFRRRSQFALILAPGLFSIGLYAYFIFSNHTTGSEGVHAFSPLFVVAGIGRAFANGLNTSFAPTNTTLLIGGLGTALLVFEMLAGWRQMRRDRLQEYVPALGIALFGLLSLIQASMFRGLLAPWYTGFAINLWIAVAAFAYLLWTEQAGQNRAVMPITSRRVAPLSIVLILTVMLLYSNRAYSDKSFLLKNRAPVSAACLRYFDTAPTYCQQFMASWSPGRVSRDLEISSVGPFLKTHALSLFSSHQELTLQGDSILNSVRYASGPLGTDAGWAAGLQPDFKPFTDFLHLNLFLSGTAKVEWTVTLPTDASTVTFVSAAATPGKGQGQIIPQLSVSNSAGQEQQIFSVAIQAPGRWYPFLLPLDQYRGQTITLRLDSGGEQGWTVYSYPRIEVEIPNPGEYGPSPPAHPSNSDLSPSFKEMAPEDYKFDLGVPGQWSVNGLERSDDEWTVKSPDPSITNVPGLNLPLDDFSDLYIKMAASANQTLGSFYAVLVTQTGDAPPIAQQLLVPLLADDQIHGYTFPLRLLSFRGAGRTRIIGISLHPVHNPAGVPSAARVKIQECGLIRVRQGTR
ncbi:MAG TPA: hypothetical protein VEZ90_14400 [Blastocatellia bacterium]|nr:hypothetical protein [Blastocatellia bacterium]